MTRAYWLTVAYNRGRNHYETRDPWDSAHLIAPCVSNDPDEQTAAIRGWNDAAAEDRGHSDPRPDPSGHPEFWTE
jgi:hypothetical protein